MNRREFLTKKFWALPAVLPLVVLQAESEENLEYVVLDNCTLEGPIHVSRRVNGARITNCIIRDGGVFV